MSPSWERRMNAPFARGFTWFTSIAVITLLGYFLFPGRTYLQSDSQIYVPMLERMRDASLFTRDITILRPHLAFTAYDEIAVGLARITGLGFETVLTIEQLVCRGLATAGL